MSNDCRRFTLLPRLLVVLLFTLLLISISYSICNKGIAAQSTIIINTKIENSKINDVTPPTIETIVSEGEQLLSKGKYEEAIKYFDKALAIEPNNVNALGGKADALFRLDRYEEAVSYYDRALAVQPTNFTVLYSKANVLPYLGKYEDAIVVYDKILAIKPHADNALGRKGLVLYDLGRSEEAITYFDKVLASKPSDAGFYLEVSKNKQMALDALKKGENINPPISAAVQAHKNKNATN